MCNHHNNDNSKLKEPRHGSALEHGSAHQKDHQQWSRRTFLRNLGIAGSVSMMLGKFPLTAMATSPLGMALNNSDNDRILVLIRFKGGNDGLNMIVPVFDYGTYQSLRPTIRIPESELISLNDEFGMPNTMADLENMWLDGHMKVVNSVGYPDQNLSHFRSTDIWASASDSDVNDPSGWMGRFLETQFPDYITNPPEEPPAIQIGGAGNIVFNNSDMLNMSVNVTNPDELFQIAQNGELYDPTDVPDCYYGEQLSYVRTVTNSTFRYAEVIKEAYDASTNAADYQYSLGEQLALVARLIKGGLSTKLYMVTLDGFDTHANQNGSHPFLMLQLSTAVKAFYEDLAAGGVAHRVMSMSFSEFGRRIEQNASGGTDHGAAAPLLLFGEGLNGNGVLGNNPDLQNLDPVGNLLHGTDFRQIYATMLEYWLCIEPDMVDNILGQNFERMPELGMDCMFTSTSAVPTSNIKHWASYADGQVNIHYRIPEGMPITVQIFNILGQPVSTLFDGYQMAGEHQHTFYTRNARLAGGHYIYSIRSGGQVYSQKIQVIR
jgi:uncharacterized protein (DUF1501 family)